MKSSTDSNQHSDLRAFIEKADPTSIGMWLVEFDRLVEQYEVQGRELEAHRTALGAKFADWRVRVAAVSEENERLQEQLQAALKDSERRTDLLNAAIDRAESAEQLYEDTHTSYTEALGEVAEAWGKYSGLKEQLEAAQDALDRIADSKKHDEAHEGYCGWCHLIDIARAANDRYPASSPRDYCNWGTVCRLPVGHEGPHAYNQDTRQEDV